MAHSMEDQSALVFQAKESDKGDMGAMRIRLFGIEKIIHQTQHVDRYDHKNEDRERTT